jgi:hypothetical protein
MRTGLFDYGDGGFVDYGGDGRLDIVIFVYPSHTVLVRLRVVSVVAVGAGLHGDIIQYKTNC